MAPPYKRRRSAGFIRNLWVYRRLVLAAILTGLMLWFILMNNTGVSVRFPFGFGPLETTSGMAILLGALAGSVVTALILTIVMTLRKFRSGTDPHVEPDPSAIPEERPPSDYASKAKEGFGDSGWSS